MDIGIKHIGQCREEAGVNAQDIRKKGCVIRMDMRIEINPNNLTSNKARKQGKGGKERPYLGRDEGWFLSIYSTKVADSSVWTSLEAATTAATEPARVGDEGVSLGRAGPEGRIAWS